MNESLEQPRSRARFMQQVIAERDKLQRQLAEEKAIVDRVWGALGIANYEQAKPLAIDEHVANLRKQLAAEREAREKAEEKFAQAYEAIEWLVSFQNGCPLPKYEENWNKAMAMCRAVLKAEPPALLTEVERLRASTANLEQSHERMAVVYRQLTAHAESAEAKLALAVDLLRYVFYYRLPTGEKLEDILIRDEESRWTEIHSQLTTAGKDVSH